MTIAALGAAAVSDLAIALRGRQNPTGPAPAPGPAASPTAGTASPADPLSADAAKLVSDVRSLLLSAQSSAQSPITEAGGTNGTPGQATATAAAHHGHHHHHHGQAVSASASPAQAGAVTGAAQ